MKTKNIFKTLALAMLMPTMLLTTACSSEDDLVNNENTATKGYALPVTINVSRQGDEGTTRATYTYDEGTKKGTLAFSAGDKLFVSGQDNTAGSFKGVLTWVSGGTFSGSINIQNDYTGTADALLTGAAYVTATLLPAGYESYAFLSIEDETDCSGWVGRDLSKAFAPTKKAAVEQFSYEYASSYSSGFALAPQTAILSFTISGLAANTEVAVLFKDAYDTGATPVNVTTDASGVATFAVAVDYGDYIDNYTLTVDGIDITLPDKTAEKGHIYNISRSVTPAPVYTLLSAATTSDQGKVVCAAGHLHDAKTAVPAGCTAVGILGKVTETGHGLILALKDATAQTWNTINGWTSVNTYAGTTLKVLPDDAARGANLTSYTALGTTAVSNWAVAQYSDYEAIFINLGSETGSEGYTYDDNVNAYITTGVGGTAISGDYWSATNFDDDYAWLFFQDDWGQDEKTSSFHVRPVLGF